MIPRLFIICLAAIVGDASAFSASTLSRPSPSTATAIHPSATRTRLSLSSSSSSSVGSATDLVEDVENDDDVTCYITNDEEIALEGEKPHVVCTSEPEEYAWFNGIDTKAMRKAEDVDIEGNENCVLGESYTGKPEWECS